MEDAYFNIFRVPYNGTQPAYYAPYSDPAGELLESNISVFVEELRSYLSRKTQRKKFFFQRMQEDWKTVEMLIYGLRYPRTAKFFPKTFEVLAQVNGVVTIYFSLLRPYAKIEPHFGDTNLAMRYHLGLVIPDGLPACGISVNGEKKAWSEGKTLAFCDAHRHEVWNQTSHERIVLIVDVLKGPYRKHQSWHCSKILSAILISRFQDVMPWLQKLPRVLTRVLHLAAASLFLGVLKVQSIFA